MPTHLPLDRVVKERFSLSWNAARAAIRTGKVFVGEPRQTITDPQVHVREDVTLDYVPNAPRPHIAERATLERDSILYWDGAIVVVNKPSGISTIPFGDETPGETRRTLDALVREILVRKAGFAGRTGNRAPLGVVHRLDKETSGVLVFTRTVDAKQSLTAQFREHTVERRYLSIVHGKLEGERTIESYFVPDRGDGLRGSTKLASGRREGQIAITHVKKLTELAGATLVECKLETGRTHQIRIHLSEAGHPVVGERVYIRRWSGQKIEAPRIMLHAADLGFEHPVNGEDMSFATPPPADFQAMLRRLTLG